MKLHDLFEMTINNSKIQTDVQTQPYFEYLTKNGKHVGDQDGLEVWAADIENNMMLYGIKANDGNIAAICTFNVSGTNTWILYVVHALTQYRGGFYPHKLLWFIKSQEGKKILDYGVDTQDGINFTKSLARSKRFGIYWYNTETGEKVKYDAQTDSTENTPYRSHEMTDWRILIENDKYPALDRYECKLVKGLYCMFE